jgi:hypothetical protein
MQSLRAKVLRSLFRLEVNTVALLVVGRDLYPVQKGARTQGNKEGRDGEDKLGQDSFSVDVGGGDQITKGYQ